ncbi:hypothetical protein Q7P37_008795 [Cladosporium fusiforme]
MQSHPVYAEPLQKEGPDAVNPDPPTSQQKLDSPDRTTKDFRVFLFLDDRWVLIQSLTCLSWWIFFVTSVVGYFTSDYRDCDDCNPFSQASMIGMGASCIGSAACLELRLVYNRLSVPGLWTTEQRQRGVVRVPWLFFAASCMQYIVAFMIGMSAYRTSRGPLHYGATPITGIIATFMSQHSGMCYLYMALSIYRAGQNDASILIFEKRQGQVVQESANDFSVDLAARLFLDTTFEDFCSLPSFVRRWIIVHAFLFVSALTLLSISSPLLWATRCNSMERKFLFEMSKTSSHIFQLSPYLAMAIPDLVFLAGGARPSNTLSSRIRHWLLVLPVLSLGLSALVLFDRVFDDTAVSYGSLLVHMQGYMTCAAMLASVLYLVALIYKPSFGAASRRRRPEEKIEMPDEKSESASGLPTTNS